MDFYLNPTDLLVINRDNQARYDEYYRIPLDSLNITYKIWAPVDQGIFPISMVSAFNKYAILWYTGDAVTDNITAEEQDSLAFFLDNGGKLLLTGQNIGEEIHSTQFFSDYLHAQLLNDSIDMVFCYSDTFDLLGQHTGNLFTVGAGGAANQYSRDVIGSDGQSYEFIFYDTTHTDCAGIWFDDQTSGFQIVYFGVGLEAVHRRPNCMTRTQLLAVIFEWFDIYGITEHNESGIQTPIFCVYPNPVRDILNISFNTGYSGEAIQLKIYDVTGRLVKDLSCLTPCALCPMHVTWQGDDNIGRRVPNGVYFVSLETGDNSEIRKIVVLK